MIDLKTPKKIRPLIDQPTRSQSTCCGRYSARRGRARVPQGTRHARRDDRPHLRVATGGAGAASRYDVARSPRRSGKQERRRPSRRCSPSWKLLGRRRPAALDAPPGTRQLGLGGGARRAARRRRHVGGNGDHRTGHRFLTRNVQTTARKDGDEYVLNGEKIYVGLRSRTDSVVVWATLDKSLGRAAKSFVVKKGNPGMRVERLEHDWRIRASDTRTSSSMPCPAEDPRRPRRRPQAGLRRCDGDSSTTPVRWSPRWRSAAPRASLDLTREILEDAGVVVDYDKPALTQSAAAPPARVGLGGGVPAHPAVRLDGRQPQAQLNAGLRVGSDVTLRCVELAGTFGYSETELLEVGPRLQDPRSSSRDP